MRLGFKNQLYSQADIVRGFPYLGSPLPVEVLPVVMVSPEDTMKTRRKSGTEMRKTVLNFREPLSIFIRGQ